MGPQNKEKKCREHLRILRLLVRYSPESGSAGMPRGCQMNTREPAVQTLVKLMMEMISTNQQLSQGSETPIDNRRGGATAVQTRLDMINRKKRR